MKIQCLLFILMFALVFSGEAREQPTDSLQMVLKKLEKQPVTLKRDSLIVSTLVDYFRLTKYTDNETLKLIADSLDRFAQKTKYEPAGAFNIYMKAIFNGRNGIYSPAIEQASRAKELFKKYGDTKYLNKVNQFLMSVISSSLVYYGAVVDKKERQKHLKYLNDCAIDAENNKNNHDISVVDLCYGFYYLSEKNYQKSYSYYKKSADIVEKDSINEFYQYYTGRWSQGLNLLYLNRKKEGFALINRVRKECEKPRKDNFNLFMKYGIDFYLAKYFNDANNPDYAIKYALEANEYAHLGNINAYQNFINEILFNAYNEKKDYSKAIIYLKLMYKNIQSKEMNQFNEKYSEWRVRYEDEKSQTKIKTLENEKLQMEANLQKWIRNLLIISLLIGIGLLVYIFRNYQLLKIKNRAIENSLLEGQTMERKRMASELHDNISNKILALKMRMETLENKHFTKEEKQQYDATIRYIDEVYADVRLVSHNLLPEELEQKGLRVAIESLIRKINLINRTHFDLKIQAVQKRFSLRFEYEIYITILELVNNILKHAQAKNASILIFEENQWLKFSVKDNGKGFDSQYLSDSLGIKSIHSRIESLKGKIKIDATHGTNVEVEVPI